MVLPALLSGGGLGWMPLLFMKETNCPGISARVSRACMWEEGSHSMLIQPISYTCT